MKIEFIITKVDKLKENAKNTDNDLTNDVDIAYGKFIIIDDDKIIFEYEANSGGWGNGMLETGEYESKWFITPEQMQKNPNKLAYSLFNFGWAFNLDSKFSTTRTELMIHPDGGCGTDGIKGYYGTLGCIGIPFRSEDDNKKCYLLLSNELLSNKKIDVTVRKILTR
jgi:hypothetical protein